jgi:ATP-dependent Clp protease adaptor protein ClpS
MPDKEFEHQEDTLATEEVDTEEPPMYRVILLNDDYTSMDFVVMVLENVFAKTASEAQEIMLSVHKAGSGVAGVFPREVAETKLALVHQHARAHEYPLRCIMEPE